MSDLVWEFSAIALYFGVLSLVAYFSYRKQFSDADFIIGNRSLNFWLTALAAHASDMSSWLFMGYPAVIFAKGMPQTWTGIGLLLCMFLNWQWVAPKIRIATEEYNSLTFSSYFENRLGDTSGKIRIFTALMQFFFYTIYISSALVALGLLLNTLFDIDYTLGIVLGTLIVVPYVFTGGYLTLAWIDLFQGLFLMLVIVMVPLYLLSGVGGFAGVQQALTRSGLQTSLIPDWSSKTLLDLAFLAIGWGLGYFGQPHIVTKFMGIKKVSDLKKSKYIGMSWMIIAMAAATLVGLIGVPFFQGQDINPMQVFIRMVTTSFPPFLIGLILCAVLATTINAIGSMILVLSSSMTEDLYKRLFRTHAPSHELLWVSRIAVVVVALIAFVIAFLQVSTIYNMVFYAWSGIGASFGPLILLSLYSKQINRFGAWAGILVGGSLAALWPYANLILGTTIPTLLPAFLFSALAIWLVSHLTRHATAHIHTLKK